MAPGPGLPSLRACRLLGIFDRDLLPDVLGKLLAGAGDILLDALEAASPRSPRNSSPVLGASNRAAAAPITAPIASAPMTANASLAPPSSLAMDTRLLV